VTRDETHVTALLAPDMCAAGMSWFILAASQAILRVIYGMTRKDLTASFLGAAGRRN
jgi:hypothetical protein